MSGRRDRFFIIATTELSMALHSKSFIVGMMMVPIIMAATFGFQRFSRSQSNSEDRHFAVVDETGVLHAGVAEIARQWNNARQSAGPETPAGSRMFPEPIATNGRRIEDVRRELVARVKKRELKGFVEIPAGAIEGNARLRYYSETVTDVVLPRWIETTINREILNERFRRTSVDRTEVVRLTKQVPLTMLGLPVWDAQGVAKEAEPVDQVRTQGVPIGIMMLLLFVVLSSAPALMNSVLEEKLSRTNEVMLGSVSPFEFMAGKLLGTVGVSLIVAFVYLTAVYIVAHGSGYADLVTPRLLASFIFYSLLAELLFGAIFVSIGAACSDLKDTQTMMTPVMIMLMMPAFMWPSVLRSPGSTFATVASLVPTMTPFLMLPLSTMAPPPPLWQQTTGVVLSIATTVLFVWAAGRIFRVGLLAQGKSASFAEMIRWVRIG